MLNFLVFIMNLWFAQLIWGLIKLQFDGPELNFSFWSVLICDTVFENINWMLEIALSRISFASCIMLFFWVSLSVLYCSVAVLFTIVFSFSFNTESQTFWMSSAHKYLHQTNKVSVLQCCVIHGHTYCIWIRHDQCSNNHRNILFWGRLDQNSGFHGNRKPQLIYNGKTVSLVFLGCFLSDPFYTCR